MSSSQHVGSVCGLEPNWKTGLLEDPRGKRPRLKTRGILDPVSTKIDTCRMPAELFIWAERTSSLEETLQSCCGCNSSPCQAFQNPFGLHVSFLKSDGTLQTGLPVHPAPSRRRTTTGVDAAKESPPTDSGPPQAEGSTISSRRWASPSHSSRSSFSSM